MRSSEIPIIKQQDKSPTILAQYQIVVEGKNGLREKKVLIVDEASRGHPFKAIDPKTEEEVELSATRLADVYRLLNLSMPDSLSTGTGKYHAIRIAKKREKLRKSTPVETPTEH